ncbi:MAG: BA14K family protein [Notoacmeibacter sp.]
MTASVSHKGKIGRVASMALATVISASFVAATVAPASANDFYYDEQFGDQFQNKNIFPAAGSRSVYRDETGRFFIRHGRKNYIQYWDHAPRHPAPVEKRRRDKNVETAIIAGVAGLAIGAIIAGSQNQNQRVIAQPAPRRVLPRNAFPDAPANYEPRVITYEGAFEPWTQSWADWCSDRYRSFNISNGTYTGYDGVKRFCVVK